MMVSVVKQGRLNGVTPSTLDQAQVRELAAGISVRAWRLSLDTGTVRATVPMLRGTWGRALQHLSPAVYRRVFEGIEEDRDGQRLPRYVIRAVAPGPLEQTAVEVLSFSTDAEDDATLLRAWDVASGMGLGPEREPFAIVARQPIGPPAAVSAGQAWPLSLAMTDGSASQAASVAFPHPLRLVRQGRLIVRPTLPLVAEASLRRILSLANPGDGRAWRLLASLREMELDDGNWSGERRDLVRYSASQGREIELHGIVGTLDLPNGAADATPFLDLAAWCHVGKGTVFGMGCLKLTRALSGHR